MKKTSFKPTVEAFRKCGTICCWWILGNIAESDYFSNCYTNNIFPS
jgi:hypothetical protein